ncbi:unnamed protein product [Clonostachys rosea f. rosea IK726]|uniref:Uncharacterized protein n=1 Tax=Clonostachys rosea f. rosea IK726 TaxID=1349383 RepID=A0ACA9TWE8_BIOOC|nr:unnamed protein product [Clonostachys rosea f. rosea IK726]
MSQKLPAWFWRECVKDRATVKKLESQLSINDHDQAASQSGYHIEPCIYERVTDYLFGAGWSTLPNGQPPRLVSNGLLLRLPDDDNAGDDFFASVAAKLAANFRTNLIILDYQDIQDLAEHVVGPTGTYAADTEQHYMSTYFSVADDTETEKWVSNMATDDSESVASSTRDLNSEGWGKKYDSTGLFRDMLSNLGKESILIMLLRPREFGRFWNPVCKALEAAIDKSGLAEQVLVIATDNTTHPDTSEYGPGGDYLNTRPAPRRLDIFPERTKSQESLFRKAKGIQLEERNKRVLQRAIRSLHPLPAQMLTQPYAEWPIPESATALKLFLGEKKLTWDEALEIAERMLGPFPLTIDILVSLLNRYRDEDKATQNWGDTLFSAPTNDREDRKSDRKSGSGRGKFSSNSDDDEDGINTLETLVDKSTLNADWSHIEVDPAVKSQVQRMILLLERRSQLSGILKREAGGALIYGPPGTGKTHLARIIAKETSSTMIRVTPADITSKWCGVAENNVKDLFKFARSRSPAIVFFDDADGLFRQRGGDDRGSTQAQDITNSFLNEVGGFANDPKSPLLVLATNFPNNVDTAVLRRVPNKIFIGFPTRSGRQNIFRICLREEKLGRDVELEALAARSSRFTGSDIEFVCHQAASAALEDIVRSSKTIEMPVCLEMKHFIRAMKVASPSSDVGMMKDMKSFASQYDQPSLARMNKSVEE